MTVRIQIIKVYDIEVPESELEGVPLDEREEAAIRWAYDQQTTWIAEEGVLEDASTDNAEVWEDDVLGICDGCCD